VNGTIVISRHGTPAACADSHAQMQYAASATTQQGREPHDDNEPARDRNLCGHDARHCSQQKRLAIAVRSATVTRRSQPVGPFNSTYPPAIANTAQPTRSVTLNPASSRPAPTIAAVRSPIAPVATGRCCLTGWRRSSAASWAPLSRYPARQHAKRSERQGAAGEDTRPGKHAGDGGRGEHKHVLRPLPDPHGAEPRARSRRGGRPLELNQACPGPSDWPLIHSDS